MEQVFTFTQTVNATKEHWSVDRKQDLVKCITLTETPTKEIGKLMRSKDAENRCTRAEKDMRVSGVEGSVLEKACW